MAYPVDSINKRNIFRTVKFYGNFLIIDTKISPFIIDFRLTFYFEGKSRNQDFSQLSLYSLLYIETCSLRKHRKDHSNEFMSYSK
jgi:hypothetical protein